MAVTRAERQALRAPAVQALFGEQTPTAMQLFELLEFAWHDCYSEISPSDQIVDDILVCSHGDLATLVSAVHLAVTDWRDLRMWADDVRAKKS